MKLRNKQTGEIVDVESIGHANSLKEKFGYQVTLSWKIDEHLDTCKTYNSLAELNEEWEDVPEPKEYWFIGEDGNPHIVPSEHFIFIERIKEIGNYFASKEEAEKAVEWLKARKVLFDDARGFKPDWKDTKQRKWNVYYGWTEDEDEEALCSDFDDLVNDTPGPYFATRDDANASIKAHEKEWKIYLGVEK